MNSQSPLTGRYRHLMHTDLRSPNRTLAACAADPYALLHRRLAAEYGCAYRAQNMEVEQAVAGVAAAEFVPAERIPPPAHETKDIEVAAPPEVTRTQSNQLIRFVPIITAVATVGAMAAAYYARSTVTRNPAFMMFPL